MRQNTDLVLYCILIKNNNIERSNLMAANKGYNITLVLDDVSNVNSEQYSKIIAAHSSNFNCAISNS